MSRLDQHIAAVQSKLVMRSFAQVFARTTFVMGLIVLLAVTIDKLFQILPNVRYRWVILIGIGVCAVISGVWAFVKRPTREQTAAAIDEKLRLKEKFSTAIFVRPSNDPFAMAAVHDAETTAAKVEIGKQFPVKYPKLAYATKLIFAAALAIATFVPSMNLFGQKTLDPKKPETQVAQQSAKEAVARALAAVESMPKSSQNSDEFRKLVAELHDLNKASKIDDPSRANRRALQALQEVNDQTTKEWDKARKYAEAQNEMLEALRPPDDAKGPVGEARKEISKGKFEEAEAKLEEAVKNFDKMDKKDKEDAANQMAAAAKQLQQLAQNPQVQQQIQQQLQQMGANAAQAQNMQKLMQQAAQGNQQAAQQLAQQAQQMAQQMNNGQGPNAQQQQQIQKALQQMQAQANAQNQANGLAQAAQQMANAMQGQQQQGAGQQNPQQGQQMQQAQAGMKQALQNMQGVQQALQQMAQQQQAAQQAMQQGQQCANGQCQGGAQGQQGQQAGQGKNGAFKEGQPNGQQGAGRGGPGQAAGGNSDKATSPFGIKMEQSPSQDNEKGRILASFMVKDQADPGVQRAQMEKIAKKAQEEAPDEIDSEHASRAAQKAAQEYFRTMSDDAPKK